MHFVIFLKTFLTKNSINSAGHSETFDFLGTQSILHSLRQVSSANFPTVVELTEEF